MPRVIVSEGAALDLERCRRFLNAKSRAAVGRAGRAIERQFALLETNPDIGRPFPELPEFRELLIGFGDSGYAALYRHDPVTSVVYILAFRHQKEAGH
jgi:plasmid stabilization system protein ParE